MSPTVGPARWWSRLTEPSPAVQVRADRRTARLLSTLLLVLAPLGLLSTVVQAVDGGRFGGAHVAVTIAVAAILGAYLLSRTRYFRVAGAITALIPTAGGLGVLATSTGDPGWFAFMALNPALGTLLVPLGWSVSLAAVNLVGVVVAVLVTPALGSQTAIVAVNFNLIVAALLLTAAWFRDRLEQDRRADLVARERLQAGILEGTFAGIAIVRGGVVSETNRRFVEMFGVGDEDLSGRSLEELFDPASRDALASVVAGADGSPVELRACRPDGSVFDAEVLVRRTADTHDGTDVVAIRDVTDRRQAAEALLRAQRMESVGRLAAGLAHDTNNELLVIGSFADQLDAELRAVGHPTDSVVQIRAAADRVSTLIRRVLLVGRRHDTAPSEVEVGDFARRQVDTWQQVLGAGVRLELAGLADGRVRIDPLRLEQLLLNLVLNARDALDGVGHVCIEVTAVELDRRVGDHGELPSGRYLRIGVADSGGGVPPELRDRIFDPFFSTKEEDGGTGLGLYISREIARLAAGELEVEVDGDGATFVVYLPEA